MRARGREGDVARSVRRIASWRGKSFRPRPTSVGAGRSSARRADIARATTAILSSRTLRFRRALGAGARPRRSPRPSPRPPPARDMSATTSLLDRPWPTPDELADARASALELAREAGVTGVAASDVVVTLAPYRVCPLGAHVDHQGGRVLGMALNCGITLAFVPVPDSARLPASTVLLRSDAFAGEVRFDLLDDDESMPPPSSAAVRRAGGARTPRRRRGPPRRPPTEPPRRGIVGVVRATPRTSPGPASRPPPRSPWRAFEPLLAAAADENASDALAPREPNLAKIRPPAPWRPSASASSAASSTKPPRSSPGAAP